MGLADTYMSRGSSQTPGAANGGRLDETQAWPFSLGPLTASRECCQALWGQFPAKGEAGSQSGIW